MASNVKEGWREVINLGAIAAYCGNNEFNAYLDALPECNVGLCEEPKPVRVFKPRQVVELLYAPEQPTKYLLALMWFPGIQAEIVTQTGGNYVSVLHGGSIYWWPVDKIKTLEPREG
jgi:hypothetical protein